MGARSQLDPGSIRNIDVSDGAGIARTKLAQRELAEIAIPLDRCRTWNARGTNLPDAATADDLGYVTGTLGTDFPTLQAGDIKTTTSIRYAGVTIQLPEDYEAGNDVKIRIRAATQTTTADGSCTLDVQAYLHDGDADVGSDLCATGALDMNSTSFANFDFVITATTFNPGDSLDVRIAVSYADTSGATAVIPTISKISLLADLR